MIARKFGSSLLLSVMAVGLFLLSIQVVYGSEDFNQSYSFSKGVLPERFIEIADEHVDLNDGIYEISDEAVLRDKLSGYEFHQVKEKIESANSFLELLTQEELTAAAEGAVLRFGTNETVMGRRNEISGGGITGVEVYWWGYDLYLDNRLTEDTVGLLLAGASASAIVAIWAPNFPTPHTALLKSVAQTLTMFFGGSATYLTRINQGNGTYTRFVKVPPQPSFAMTWAGTYAQ